MKILAMGDFHGKFPGKLKKRILKEDPDLILCTGDLGGSDELLKYIFKYFHQKWWNIVGEKKANKLVLEDYNSGKRTIGELNKLGRKLNKKVFVINGNWDFVTGSKWERTAGLELDRYPTLMKRTKNVQPINRSFKKINGLNILFFGGSVTAKAYTQKGVLSDEERAKYIKKNKKQKEQLNRYNKNEVDILFAHYPPAGYFDKVKYKGKNPMNGKLVGFEGYTEFIRKKQPALFVCGHMHEYQGVKNFGKTVIVATGSAKDGKAAIIDFDEVMKKVKSVKFLK